MDHVTVATLKLFGGHAALDFTNTVDSRGPRWGPDVLQCHDDLLDWSVRIGLVSTAEAQAGRSRPAAESEAALVRAKALREAIYRIFATRPADQADLGLLQREVLWAQAAREIVAEPEGYRWRWQQNDPDTVIRRLALSAAELLMSHRLSRVRSCAGENCGWLFLDTSRSGHRVWCSEETCGTRNRVRRWRARRDEPAG